MAGGFFVVTEGQEDKMVIVMAPEVTQGDIDSVVDLVRAAGGEAFVSRGVSRTIIGLVGDVDHFGALNLRSRSGVSDVIRVSVPYKLVSREHHSERSVISVGGVPIGPSTMTLIAGPCSVETPEQTLSAALMAKEAGASLLRGGAFKPRSSPYAFQGLGEAGLKILAEVRAEVGLPIVTEVVDPASVDLVCAYADMLQVGTRNMQNFALLQAVGSAGKPVMLKRGMNATIEEWLMAAEYIAQRGNLDIVLCERGIRTFETATRNTLDISAVPVAQRLSHLPVIIDPSHSGGRRDLVLPLTRAAIAVGADGVIIDVHPEPAKALCDGDQALADDDIRRLAEVMRSMPAMLGRILALPPDQHPATAPLTRAAL
jgi:3-deoxy-7-phosphoheptulonate synthase